MNAPKLDKRLRAVVDNICGEALADIGCDHGKVTVCALLENKVKNAIACDISQKSLDKAVALAKAYNLVNIDFRQGDGLTQIEDGEADCAVIAGMGGREIISILSYMPQGIRRFVLVAHKNTIELRSYLSSKNLYIDKDFIVEQSGKFYDIIVATLDSGKSCDLSEKQLYLGKNSYDNADYVRFIDLLRQKRERLKDFEDKSNEAKMLTRIFAIIDEEQSN